MNRLINRIEELEQAHGGQQPYNGAIRVIWHGPEDDAKLAAAEREAEASGKRLIIRAIVDPKERPDHVQ